VKTKPHIAVGVNRPRIEVITTVPARESELSITLNCLIGEANCEAALLPLPGNVGEWSRDEMNEGLIRCQRAMIATLLCAIELQMLDGIDAHSRLWIREATQKCEEHQKLFELIQGDYHTNLLTNE
jgi:hypothetical protein